MFLISYVHKKFAHQWVSFSKNIIYIWNFCPCHAEKLMWLGGCNSTSSWSSRSQWLICVRVRHGLAFCIPYQPLIGCFKGPSYPAPTDLNPAQSSLLYVHESKQCNTLRLLVWSLSRTISTFVHVIVPQVMKSQQIIGEEKKMNSVGKGDI